MAQNHASDFELLYLIFKNMLIKHAVAGFQLRALDASHCDLVGPPTPRSHGKEVWFGAARIGKNYVSYHLMPVYACPDLLNGISPELRKHMQGKSCFNFTHVDEKLFQELDELTNRGYERFKTEGFLG